MRRGQITTGYLVLFAAVLLIAIAAFSKTYSRSVHAEYCAKLYNASAQYLASEKLMDKTDQVITYFNCDFNANKVDVRCYCKDPLQLKGVIEDELNKMGMNTVAVNVVRET